MQMLLMELTTKVGALVRGVKNTCQRQMWRSYYTAIPASELVLDSSLSPSLFYIILPISLRLLGVVSERERESSLGWGGGERKSGDRTSLPPPTTHVSPSWG